MTLEEIAPKALEMPAEQRAILAASLWESIDDPYSMPGDLSDEEALALARSRDEEIESGSVKAITHEDLMKKLR